MADEQGGQPQGQQQEQTKQPQATGAGAASQAPQKAADHHNVPEAKDKEDFQEKAGTKEEGSNIAASAESKSNLAGEKIEQPAKTETVQDFQKEAAKTGSGGGQRESANDFQRNAGVKP